MYQLLRLFAASSQTSVGLRYAAEHAAVRSVFPVQEVDILAP